MVAILLFFFLSGFSALVYEIIWTRQITSIIGASAFSVSIVLSSFMGGMALGAWIAARLVDRVRSPPRLLGWYGFLEIVIGLYALLFPLLLAFLLPVFQTLYRSLYARFFAYEGTVFLISFILFLPPTILMGATLPILCRYGVERLSHLGGRAGRLYGANTLGAALGSLACGFVLIRFLGVSGSLRVAVAINLALGAICLLWAAVAQRSGLTTPGPRTAVSWSGLRGVLLVFALSGFCSMAAEVIWTRLLGLLAGPTTYSFTLVLFTFIVGLGIGSVFWGWVADRVRDPLPVLLFTQVGAALAILLISQLMGNAQLFFAKLIFELQGRFVLLEASKAAVLFALMAPATFLLGATFPLVCKKITRSLDQVGHAVGTAYTINTIGAFLGAAVAGFILVPRLGKENGLSLLVALQAGAAAWVGLRMLRRRMAWPLAVVALGIVAAAVVFPRWNRNMLAEGKYHRFDRLGVDLDNLSYAEALLHGADMLEDRLARSELIYYGDGIGGFTTVIRETDVLGQTDLYMANSGKIDASSRGDIYTQTMAGHLGLLMHSNATDVLVIGLGCGMTAGEVLHYPVERMDAVELSPQVVEAAELFEPWNNRYADDPRTETIVEDALTHVTLTDRSYDVITSEPSNPWMAGLANLFTVDYFRAVRDRLKPGGLLVQFLHTYQTDWNSLSLMLRSLTEVFPRCYLFRPAVTGSDYLVLAFKDEDGELPTVEDVRARIPYAALSSNISLTAPEIPFLLITAENLEEVAGEGPLHTADRPLLEYTAPMHMFGGGDALNELLLDRRALSPRTQALMEEEARDVDMQLAFARYVGSGNILPFNLVDTDHATPEQRAAYLELAKDFARRNPIPRYDLVPPDALPTVLAEQERLLNGRLIELAGKTDAAPDEWGDVYAVLAQIALARRDYPKALTLFQRGAVLSPDRPEWLAQLAQGYEALRQPVEAAAIRQRLRRLQETDR